jgi:hypothetical protein
MKQRTAQAEDDRHEGDDHENLDHVHKAVTLYFPAP